MSVAPTVQLVCNFERLFSRTPILSEPAAIIRRSPAGRFRDGFSEKTSSGCNYLDGPMSNFLTPAEELRVVAAGIRKTRMERWHRQEVEREAWRLFHGGTRPFRDHQAMKRGIESAWSRGVPSRLL